MRKIIVFGFIILIGKNSALAQKDTSAHVLDSITVNSYLKNQLKQKLPDVYETFIYADKKTDLVSPDASKGNITQNIARLQFAQIAGLNMWDMDGAGTQLNIGTRGTDSHREIEMNMRQNGYTTNSDGFDYPENHYTVPLQGV